MQNNRVEIFHIHHIISPRASKRRSSGGGAEGAKERVGWPGGAALAGQGSRVLHKLKVISCNSTRYNPSWKKRAVDVRALKLPDEYLEKARAADCRQGVQQGEVGRVEAKLVGMGTVRGLVSGNFGEMSEDTHLLVAAMANSRVRVAGPTRGRRGRMRGEEAERSIAVSAIRRRLGVMAVGCQSSTLLGRLETLGPGGAASAGRRWQASELQRRWQQEDTLDSSESIWPPQFSTGVYQNEEPAPEGQRNKEISLFQFVSSLFDGVGQLLPEDFEGLLISRPRLLAAGDSCCQKVLQRFS